MFGQLFDLLVRIALGKLLHQRRCCPAVFEVQQFATQDFLFLSRQRIHPLLRDAMRAVAIGACCGHGAHPQGIRLGRGRQCREHNRHDGQPKPVHVASS